MVPEVGLGTPPGIESSQVVGSAIGSISNNLRSDGFLVQNRGQGASSFCQARDRSLTYDLQRANWA